MTKSFTNQIFVLALMLTVTISYGQKRSAFEAKSILRQHTPFTIGKAAPMIWVQNLMLLGLIIISLPLSCTMMVA